MLIIVCSEHRSLHSSLTECQLLSDPHGARAIYKVHDDSGAAPAGDRPMMRGRPGSASNKSSGGPEDEMDAAVG
jgi:hypothetical protein